MKRFIQTKHPVTLSFDQKEALLQLEKIGIIVPNNIKDSLNKDEDIDLN